MKKLLILLGVGLLGFGAWYVWTKKPFQSDAGSKASDPTIVKAEKRDLDFSIEISGDVQPTSQLDVKPEVGGKLITLHVEPGQTVKEGEILVEIDDSDLLIQKQSSQTEIEGTKLTVEISRKNFERSKELYESNLVSVEEYDNIASKLALAENSMTKAQRNLDQIEEKLRKTKVSAPADGTILTVPVTEGQVVIAAASVNSGTTLMTIANLSHLQVETHINQVDVSRLELNRKVKLRAESLRDVEMEAKISFIAPIATVKNNVKGFDVQALIEKPNPRLKPGMTVNMTVPIAKARDALTVPITAVFKGDRDVRVVYVRTADGKVEQREVQIGVTNYEYAQILNVGRKEENDKIEGLDENEDVLLAEPDRLQLKKS